MLLSLLLAATVAQEAPMSARLVTGAPPQVELRNTGTQPINAWAFAVTSPNASGGIHREFHSADVYLSEVTGGLQGAAPHLQRIMPGDTRIVPVDAAPPNASVQVIAVVLDDNTALGDEQTIGSFFEKRVRERDELKDVVDAFEDAMDQAHGRAALQQLQRRLAPPANDPDSVPHRSAREAVGAWLQRAGASAEEIDASIRTYAAFVSRQHQVAVGHAVRNRG